jgi:hypothetical protein
MFWNKVLFSVKEWREITALYLDIICHEKIFKQSIHIWNVYQCQYKCVFSKEIFHFLVIPRTTQSNFILKPYKI